MTTLGWPDLSGDRPNRVIVVAEIGINHNGDLDRALSLVRACADAGADVVKFQKRTVDVVYSAEELARPRVSPFGSTNGDLKRGLEFGLDEYTVIDGVCRELGVPWTASAWDVASLEFVDGFAPPFHKVASPCLTDMELLAALRRCGRPVVVSTGMSTADQVDTAVTALHGLPLVLLHCVSSYPTADGDANLRMMDGLRRHGVPVGYSGHELDDLATLAAVARGAAMVERHVTQSRMDWGSDQSVSLEMEELGAMVGRIRRIEEMLGVAARQVLPCEEPSLLKLRKAG